MSTDSNPRQDPTDTASANLRRRKRTKTTSHKRNRRSWQGLIDLLLLLLAVVGILILFRVPPAPELLGEWDITLVTGLTILLVAVTLGFGRVRKRIIYHAAWWSSYGCPECHFPQLKRQRSSAWHRFLRHPVGIPVRRYICPECSWVGTRVEDTHL